MSIGLVGVSLSLLLGILLGGISGYYGGRIDNVIQRVIEFLLSLPTIPLWLGLAAAMPPTLPPLQVYFVITLILSLVGWTGLARVVRGRFLALRNEDFVTAARLDGAQRDGHHLPPHGAVLRQPHHRLRDPRDPGDDPRRDRAVFLGLGLSRRSSRWGVLLQEAQNIRAVATGALAVAPRRSR